MSSCCISFFSMYAITFYYIPALTSCLPPQSSNTLSNLMLKSAKSDPSVFFSCFQPASSATFSGWWFFATPLKNMKVKWEYYSQLNGHKPFMFQSPPTSFASQPPPPNLHLTPSYAHLEAHAHHLCQKSAQATTRGQATHDEIDHGGFDTFLGRFWVQRFQRDYGSNTSLDIYIYIYINNHPLYSI